MHHWPFTSRDGAPFLRATPVLVTLVAFLSGACRADGSAKLVITPDEPFLSSGDAYGVVDPLAKQYTLTNTGSVAATVNVEYTSPVHFVDMPAAGTLGAGESWPIEIRLWSDEVWHAGEYSTEVRFTAPEAEPPHPVVQVTVTIGPTPLLFEATSLPCYTAIGERLAPGPGFTLYQLHSQHALGGSATVRVEAPGLEGTVELTKPLYHVADFPFEDLRAMQPGRHALVATPTFEGPPVSGLVPVSVPLAVGLVGRQVIPWRTAPITVDGSIGRDEWAGGSPLLFGYPQQDVLPGHWTDPADYRGEVRLRQDADSLFFSVEAKDDFVAFPTTTDTELYNRDGLELFLGLGVSDCRRTAYGPGDFQVIVSADDYGQGNLTARWFSPQAAGTVYGNPSSVAARRTSDGYVIEGCLPWALLKPGFAPTQDTVIGFNLMAKDLDSPTPGEDSAFNLTGLENASTDPSGWTTAGPGASTPGYVLHWAQSPGLSGVNQPLHPTPVIDVRRFGADIATTYEGPVTLTLQNNVGDGWLRGATTVFAVKGRAEFRDVTIDRRGYYSLLATANGATPEASRAFDVWEAYVAADVLAVLRYAAGLAEGGIDRERLDISRNGAIELEDAARMARKVAGMDVNP